MKIHQETLRRTRPHPSAGKHRRTIAGAFIASTIAGVLAFTGGAATAVEAPDNEHEPKICFEQVVKSRYERPTFTTNYRWDIETRTEKTKIQYEIDKYMRERNRTSAQHYSWNGGNRPLNDPPTAVPPHPDWQPNTKQEPHNGAPVGLHVQGGSESNASWFYYVPFGNWSAWSAPTRWQPIGSHLAWVDVVPAANWAEHGNSYTDTYQRDWAEYPTGTTRQVPDGLTPWTAADSTEWGSSDMPPADTETTRYVDKQVDDKVPGTPQDSGWVTSPPAGEGWTFVESREFQGGQIPCPISPSTLGLTYNQDCAPDATNTWRVRPTGVNQPVAWELFQDGVSIRSGTMQPGDGETVVEVDRKQPSTAVLKWDSDGNGSLDKATPKASGPDLTSESNPEKCVIEVTPAPPSVTQPTCDAAGSVVIPEETIGYDWLKQDDGTYLAVADRGYVFPEGFDPTFDPGNLAQLDGPWCDAPLTTVIPTGPAVKVPNCSAAGGYTVPGLSGAAKQTGVIYTTSISADASDETGTVVVEASPDAGYEFAAGARTTWKIRPSELTQVTGDTCVEDEVVALPPVAPTQPPPVVALPPTPPQVWQLPPTAVSPESGALPATGRSTRSTLLLALAALGTGSALLALRRRPA